MERRLGRSAFSWRVANFSKKSTESSLTCRLRWQRPGFSDTRTEGFSRETECAGSCCGRSDYLMTTAGAALFATNQVDRCSLLTGDRNWMYCQPCHFCKCCTELWNQRVSLRNERSEWRDFKRSTVTQLIFRSKNKTKSRKQQQDFFLFFFSARLNTKFRLTGNGPMKKRHFCHFCRHGHSNSWTKIFGSSLVATNVATQQTPSTNGVDCVCSKSVSLERPWKGQLMGPHLTTKCNFLPPSVWWNENKSGNAPSPNHTPIIGDPCALEQTSDATVQMTCFEY